MGFNVAADYRRTCVKWKVSQSVWPKTDLENNRHSECVSGKTAARKLFRP